MNVLYPTIMVRRVMDITAEKLADIKVSALILDLDNTLTTHNNPKQDPAVLEWLAYMRKSGIKMTILSNNTKKRVLPFARELKLDFIAVGLKPLPFGYARAIAALGVPKKNVAVVGDQLFTDVLGARLYSAKAILVEPFEHETHPLFRLKRKVESKVLKRYKKLFS